MQTRWLAVIGGLLFVLTAAALLLSTKPARATYSVQYIGCYICIEDPPPLMVPCEIPVDDWGNQTCTHVRENDGTSWCYVGSGSCYGIEVPGGGGGGGGGGGSCSPAIGSGCPASCPSCTYTY